MARDLGQGGKELEFEIGCGVCLGRNDMIKVIDQGSDESVNAVSIRRLIRECTGVPETYRTEEATIIQSRHRVPEVPLREAPILEDPQHPYTQQLVHSLL